MGPIPFCRICLVCRGMRTRSRTARRPGSGPRRLSASLGLAAVSMLIAVTCLWAGCGQPDVSKPETSPTNIVVAYYQPPERFTEDTGLIELNGERIDKEWGSEFTPERPFSQVRVSAESGNGNPGTPRYVSMKAVYTDTHLYLLLQWADWGANELKDAFRYVGPSLGSPIISCVQVGAQTVCDSLYRRGAQDSLMLPIWWERFGDDDKIALAFEVAPVEDARGTFESVGCLAACHVGSAPPFGAVGAGELDIWYWLAGRTNPLRNIFNLADDPNEPRQGIPGYLDDWYAIPGAGLLPDPGWPGYLVNALPGSAVPRYVYRRADDPFYNPPDPDHCPNRFGERCLRNNGVSFAYLWREIPTIYFQSFSPQDTLNETITPDVRKWVRDDIVPGYFLTYPSDSRADVRGKGNYDEERAVWTLEVARRLDTGAPAHDVVFDPEAGKSYYFTIAVFDASTQNHWGSEPQILQFGPKR